MKSLMYVLPVSTVSFKDVDEIEELLQEITKTVRAKKSLKNETY